ncbi:hypothetical protein CCR75_004374 [Bremia lactucae]|uniref:RING-type domain-containing protein n=1 Tax=Bremia lactucae TaxID=4779 RepID=A0A976FK78_BRELC|nr:hypothetical protein CCR75_004374 [Bremia lactucae]
METLPSTRIDGISVSMNHQHEDNYRTQHSVNEYYSQEKAETDEVPQQEPAVLTNIATSLSNRAAESRRIRFWRTENRQQIIDCTRNCCVRSLSMQQQPLDGNLAQDFESEAAESRTLIAQTAELWSVVDQAEHHNRLESLWYPAQRTSAASSEDESSTVSEDASENDEEQENGIDFVHGSSQCDLQDESLIDSYRSSIDDFQEINHAQINREIDEIDALNASNRAINASKGRVIQKAMLIHLVRLGFQENLARTALEAGVRQIAHYDADCELAYVDIFMSLVKTVCDAHVDVATDSLWRNKEEETYEEECQLLLPFKWPVFDMAQFELNNARPGTCFNSVCVLTNLPKVALDRTDELVEVLSCQLFCMVGDPIQVVVPSARTSGRTKGHAFLEFDDPKLAKKCAEAIDGLTWGRGPFGQIRGNLFRQYQAKSFGEYAQQNFLCEARIDQACASSSIVEISRSEDEDFSLLQNRLERYRPHLIGNDCAVDQNVFCDSDDDSNASGDYVDSRPHECVQFSMSPLLDQSSGSVEQEQVLLDEVDNWPIEAVSNGKGLIQRLTERGDDSYENDSDWELQTSKEDMQIDQSNFQQLPKIESRGAISHNEAQATPSTTASIASAAAREALVGCGMIEQSWEVQDDYEDRDKPWRRYCEDVIAGNRVLHDQMTFTRRRIVQLSRLNQNLNLLVDSVERDRDGLLMENELLQTQLHGYADHDQHHDSLMQELMTLRKCLDKEPATTVVKKSRAGANDMHASLYGIQSSLSLVTGTALNRCTMEELKDWEQVLETTLSYVRSVKEDKALEMQKRLDRQVEEQNELKLCVICLADEKTILCLPCRHLCLCKGCSRHEEVVTCPICRLEIQEMLAVYS